MQIKPQLSVCGVNKDPEFFFCQTENNSAENKATWPDL